MKSIAIIGSIYACSLVTYGSAYGSLSNFDVVNDTGDRCYGFEIELEDIHSTDITYTYNYNHYGAPRITEDSSDPSHPRTFVRYEARRNADGSYASFTNPQDPLNPLAPTNGHAFTNPNVNLGGEHFGLGYRTAPTLVRYHWLVDDPVNPGSLVLGPAVNVATPSFTYVPPPAPAMPAVVRVVIVPPPPEVPEVEPPVPQFGVPVWVKVLTTVQPSGRKIELDELLPLDEVDNPGGVAPWQGEVEQPETEIEWMVFQRRPAGDPDGEGEVEGADELPNADETITRRYEFYEYQGPTNPEDGEAQCDNPDNCDGAVGKFIGAQMAGFNVDTPLGLIEQVQDGEILVPYVDRTLVVGGTPPYLVSVTTGDLPDGLTLDPVEGVLSGVPAAGGSFPFSVEAVDVAGVSVVMDYTLKIVDPLRILPAALPLGTELEPYAFALAAEGGVAPYAWAAEPLPQGLDLNADGTISGVPAAGTAGDYDIMFLVTDSQLETAAVSLSLSIESAPPQPGDLNGDSVVDRADLAVIVAGRNTPATGPDDPRDLDHDGWITALDARKCVTLFSSPGGR
ncbi:MAG: putative Ig domain-containing protein [Verrucomicrobiales bacterium]|nr:putative Ig domain-containing protein [Verrucomicrobiales bacterium]